MEEDDNTPPLRPMAMMGPGMRIWLLFALFFACMGLLNMLSKSRSLAWLDAGPNDDYPVNFVRYAQAIGELICYLIPAIVYANIFPPDRFRWLKVNVRISVPVALFGMAAMVFTIYGFNWLAEWTMQFIRQPALKEIQDANEKVGGWLQTMAGPNDLLVMLLCSAVAPAIFEEIFYRGCVQQLFTGWTKNHHAGIFITSAIFSLMHFNPAGTAEIFISSVMFGYAFYWTGSLRMNILMHFAFNATSILLVYADQHSAAFHAWEPSALLSLSGFVVSAALMFLIFRQRRVVTS